MRYQYKFCQFHVKKPLESAAVVFMELGFDHGFYSLRLPLILCRKEGTFKSRKLGGFRYWRLVGFLYVLGAFLFHVSGLPFPMQENSIVWGIEKPVKGKRMKRETPHINITNFPASKKITMLRQVGHFSFWPGSMLMEGVNGLPVPCYCLGEYIKGIG